MAQAATPVGPLGLTRPPCPGSSCRMTCFPHDEPGDRSQTSSMPTTMVVTSPASDPLAGLGRQGTVAEGTAEF